MKTLKDHIILYDNECPICDLYTGAFVKTGMLDKKGKVAFTEATELMRIHHVDRGRACDEIALIDTKTGNINYGVDSLMRILQYRFTFLKAIFTNAFFIFVIRKIYSFISFNRKVIIPGKSKDTSMACRPSFNLSYRVAYILLTWLITSFILANYATLLQPLISPTNFYREFLICGGQILFQGAIMIFIDRKKTFEYLGNMMTVSFAGGLLLMPAILFESFISDPMIFAALFGIVVALMFLEHFRRMKVVNLPWAMTLTWVVYRILVLVFLL